MSTAELAVIAFLAAVIAVARIARIQLNNDHEFRMHKEGFEETTIPQRILSEWDGGLPRRHHSEDGVYTIDLIVWRKRQEPPSIV